MVNGSFNAASTPNGGIHDRRDADALKRTARTLGVESTLWVVHDAPANNGECGFE
jgi:hypothetical protein